jgi:hypothetical protein
MISQLWRAAPGPPGAMIAKAAAAALCVTAVVAGGQALVGRDRSRPIAVAGSSIHTPRSAPRPAEPVPPRSPLAASAAPRGRSASVGAHGTRRARATVARRARPTAPRAATSPPARAARRASVTARRPSVRPAPPRHVPRRGPQPEFGVE